MSDLTRESLPTPESRRPLLPVEALGGTLYARCLSAADGTDLPEDPEGFLAALLIKSIVYADGTQVWTEEAQVLAYPRRDLAPCLQGALKANHMTEDKVEEVKGN